MFSLLPIALGVHHIYALQLKSPLRYVIVLPVSPSRTFSPKWSFKCLLPPPDLLAWLVSRCRLGFCVKGMRCRYRLPGLQVPARGRRRPSGHCGEGSLILPRFHWGAPKSGCISVHKFFGPPRSWGEISAEGAAATNFGILPHPPKFAANFFLPFSPFIPGVRLPQAPQAHSKQTTRSPDSTHRKPLHFSSCALIRQAGTRPFTSARNRPSFLFPLKTRTRTQAST